MGSEDSWGSTCSVAAFPPEEAGFAEAEAGALLDAASAEDDEAGDVVGGGVEEPPHDASTTNATTTPLFTSSMAGTVQGGTRAVDFATLSF
jgi:hypothetical protein